MFVLFCHAAAAARGRRAARPGAAARDRDPDRRDRVPGLPAQLGFVERTDAGIWQRLYDVIYRLDNRFNTVPSFHVIYTASILLAFIDVATPGCAWLYLAWLVVVCASTVLTHRHHLLDVAAGLAIAVAVRSLFPRPMPSLSTETT